MESVFWNRLLTTHLTLDRTDFTLEFDEREVEAYYLPLAQRLTQKAGNQPRFLVAIAGPPGSGKSAFSALLSAVINAWSGMPLSANIGLDGWHYSNAYLDSHTTLTESIPAPLRLFKGSPITFDAAAAFASLQGIRDGSVSSYPVYSRAGHDPIANAGTLTPQQRIVLVEGNYLLLIIPPWKQFGELFDLSIFLTAPRDALEDAIRQRHLRGGKDAGVVQQQLDLVDLPDIDLVLTHSSIPDILVEKSDSRRILAIHEVE